MQTPMYRTYSCRNTSGAARPAVTCGCATASVRATPRRETRIYPAPYGCGQPHRPCLLYTSDAADDM
eukprot:613531-Prymnesium_polylepis.1